jgi:hypothetical protein
MNMLTSQQEDFLKKGEIEGSYLPDEWIALLKEFLANYKAHIEWQEKNKKKHNLYFAFTFLFTLLLSFWLISWWSVLVAFLLASVINKYRKNKFIIYYILPNSHLEDLTQNYFLPLFRFLSFETNQKIEAKLNFLPDESCRTDTNLYKTEKYNIAANTYVRPIVALKTILADKTHLFISVSQKIIVKNKQNKYRARKFKSKTKKITIYNVKAVFHQKNYASPAENGNLKFELKSKQEGLHSDLQPLLELIAQLYMEVKPISA